MTECRGAKELMPVTFADDDVALEVDPVALWELEHGVELGLGGALDPVVLELRQDVRIGAPEMEQFKINYHLLFNLKLTPLPNYFDLC